jgi:phospholipid/cholesterol/gamma-HCH transport system permease protein
MKLLSHIGRFTLLMLITFKRPESWKSFRKRIVTEMNDLGLDSLPIIAVISVFMGAVVTIQTSTNIDSGFIPLYTVGFAARQSVILEFSPTIIALILVGKVGSSISSEIGTMRVSEQIDALEIMGINSANFLIFPKIIAAVIINPFLITLSMAIGIAGGYAVAVGTGLIGASDYEYGIQLDFKMYDYYYAMIKTVVFAFVLTSIPAYFGYYTSGGSVEVGKSSTTAVVVSSIVILILNYLLTQLLLI